MNEYIEKERERFNREKDLYENAVDKESYIKERINETIRNTNLYYETEDTNLKKELLDNLINNYNILIYYARQDNRNSSLLDYLDDLPNLFLIEQKPERFDINEELLNNINIEEGLTIEQATELLKWTSNNTRDNFNILFSNKIKSENVYDNSSLMGACGFSQFSTLYPLQQLGLKITINNMHDFNGFSHAYGTVIIPIKTEEQIIEKRFLIDCTYRQFFLVNNNVFSSYTKFNNYFSSPETGFFVQQDKSCIEFSKKLLKDGFIEATEENLKNYFKPFYLKGYEMNDLEKATEEFEKLDIIDIIDNRQEEFDYEEKEFEEWNMNLEIPIQTRMNFNRR